ncbi:response regulator transcription factor [Ensifer sp. OTU672]|uniref:response regulator transcription factor n=1 Tax=Ensifer sp. OTU672 TaxID=3043861 RepID=UPI00313C231E
MNRIPTPQVATEALSDRERAVAERFAAGLTYREIGGALFIAPSTVRTHLATIYGKLGVRQQDRACRLGRADGGRQDGDRGGRAVARRRARLADARRLSH